MATPGAACWIFRHTFRDSRHARAAPGARSEPRRGGELCSRQMAPRDSDPLSRAEPLRPLVELAVADLRRRAAAGFGSLGAREPPPRGAGVLALAAEWRLVGEAPSSQLAGHAERVVELPGKDQRPNVRALRRRADRGGEDVRCFERVLRRVLRIEDGLAVRREDGQVAALAILVALLVELDRRRS
jgi:hypothetical protein